MILSVNAANVEIPEELVNEPLLPVLRDYLQLTGTKFGCGKGLCGACTVHVDGEAIRSCVTPVKAVLGRVITTIEGLAATHDATTLHPVQRAWIEDAVPQCGYCQAGQIMTAAAMLAANSAPSMTQIKEVMNGNICRCGTYGRIRKAILRASEDMNDG